MIQTKIYKKLFFKLSAIALLVALNVGFLNISLTNAFYNDSETANGNNFTAGALDFTITDDGFVPAEAVLNFEPTITASKNLDMALESVSNPIKYYASTTNLTGDIPFCDAINLEASLNEENQFSGSLSNFVSSATTTVGLWHYDFSLMADSSFYNNVCSFDFEYNGRQTLPHNEYEEGGYYDIERAGGVIYSWGFRINKVYYDVDSEHGVEGDNEWVEIYNQTDQNLDISGWQVCDNIDCDIILTSEIVPAKGFAIITASSTTWDYWDIPSDVVKIVLNSKIGNGLNNDGDMLVLKRPDGVVIDEMNWQTNTEIWNPGAVDVAEGNILGRVSTGVDTNTAEDWKELFLPTVNMIYPVGGETWYVGNEYDIQWAAYNGNGEDDVLKISLWYSADSGNTWVKFASDIDNTGTFHWKLPLFIDGYYIPSHNSKIKVVAVGPENFMVQNFGSSEDFCPPINYDALTPEEQQLVDMLIESGVIDPNDVIRGGVENIGESIATTTPEITTEESITTVSLNTENDDIKSATTSATTTEEILGISDENITISTSTANNIASSSDEIVVIELEPIEESEETIQESEMEEEPVNESENENLPEESNVIEQIIEEEAIKEENEPEIIEEISESNQNDQDE
ncbi:MAG: lamin tail domain-containing protein [Candidatus Zambryskibacteria bacterium]|nr:lamin tail domain-containing protein [Candidatus Zambryskibacteria bacterium]